MSYCKLIVDDKTNKEEIRSILVDSTEELISLLLGFLNDEFIEYRVVYREVETTNLPKYCPECGSNLSYAEHLDTGTSVDCYEATCENGHKFGVSHDRVDNSVIIKLLIEV